MERLTNKREADAQREEYERRLANGYPRNIPEERFLRLAAYEDTRLTPEKVDKLTKDWTDLCTIVGECGGISRVRELAEADKDGRLVVRPYRLGAEVYILLEDCAMFYPETNGWYIGKETIDAITPDGFYLGDPADDCFTPDSEIGKAVFLTSEEAEAALEAMKK